MDTCFRSDTAAQAANPTIIALRWLVFLRVVAVGSLSKAAAALDMPQSMVSRHIAQLEQQCGERLFRRTGRGVVLTEVGEQLLPRISELAAGAERLADDIRSVRGQPVGEVMVGLLPAAVARYAGPLFAAARAQLPGVRLHLSEGASAQLEEHLREGRLDMAIVLREEAQAGGTAGDTGTEDLLARMPLHVVGLAGDPLLAAGALPFSALDGLPLVVPGRPHRLRARLDRLGAEHTLRLDIAVEVDSARLQYEVAAAGGGYAIAAAPPPGQERRLAAARIISPMLERFVVLAVSPRRPHTRATRAVQRLIRAMADRM
ncbi:MAG: LysR family transcriptional regulator [Burkholderiaceae bacterium]|nr:LysR family transcriptional regulator [Burkholderiaceae bacterium]